MQGPNKKQMAYANEDKLKRVYQKEINYRCVGQV